MSLKCIGIDIGGTSVKLGIFEEDGTLVKKWEIPTRKRRTESISWAILRLRSAEWQRKAVWSSLIFPEREWDSLDRFFRTDTAKCV